MPKNNPAAKNKMVTPKVKGSWWNRDMSMLTTLVPLKYLPVDWIDVPGRTQVDVSPKIDIESLPAVSPLYDGWTLETYYYFVPYRLYMPTLRINNVEDVGELDSEMFPRLCFECSDGPNSGNTAPRTLLYFPYGSLLERLGYLTGNLTTMGVYGDNYCRNYHYPDLYRSVYVNAVPLLAYIDTWLYGQFNKQDKSIPVEYNYGGTFDINGILNTSPNPGFVGNTITFVDYDDLKKVIPAVGFGKSLPRSSGSRIAKYSVTDNMFTFGNDNQAEEYVYKDSLVPNYVLFDSVDYFYGDSNSFRSVVDYPVGRLSNVGLLPVTYYGDRFTSWFDADSISKLQDYTFRSQDSVLTMRKINSDMMLDMISMVSGNDYRSYLKFVFGTELDLCDHPILVGKDSLSFGFMDVLNQSANVSTDDDVSPDKVSQSLAYTAGKARSKNNNVRDINFKTREPGLFMVTCALRPTIRYFQGKDAFLFKTELSEVWHPQYSSLGFDQLNLGQIYSHLIGTPKSSAVYSVYGDTIDKDNLALEGYVPLGWEYQTGMRKLGSAMATTRYRTWSLARDLSFVERAYVLDADDYTQARIKFASSTYGNRGNFDFNFVDTSDEAQNFIMSFSARVRCYQPMSKVLVKPTI